MDLKAAMEQILAAPDEEGPRLVWADLLQEKGDPRGELIGLQCELEHLPVDGAPRRMAIRQREAELMKAHEAEWLPAFDPPDSALLLQLKFRRGFIEEASVRFTQLEKDLAALLACTPFVRRLIVLGPDGPDSSDFRPRALKALAGFEPVRQLATLELRDPAVGDAELAALAGVGTLAGLRSLKCQGHRIGDGGVVELAAAKSLAELRELVLPRGQIGETGAKAIAGSPAMARLTHLDLSDNPLQAAGRDVLRGWFERHAAKGPWVIGDEGAHLRRVEGDPFVIGSGALCQFVVRGREVGREHLVLWRREDGWSAEAPVGNCALDGRHFSGHVLVEGRYRLGGQEIRVVFRR